MPLIAAHGTEFHVQELGARDGGVPVVMLHGLLVDSMASWFLTSAPALARERRVCLFDLRGHGKSAQPPAGYDAATQTADLAALIDHWTGGCGPVALCGHSWGAYLALRYALENPGRVASLALVEAPVPPSKFGEFEAFLGRSPDEMLDALPAPIAAAVGAQGLDSRRVRRFAEGMHALLTETSVLDDLAAAPDIPDADLAGIACPTLLVYGSESSCRPCGNRLAAAIPAARLEVLPGGHYLLIDQEPRLTTLLCEWFGG